MVKKGDIVTYLNQRTVFGLVVEIVEMSNNSPMMVKVVWLHKEPSAELVHHLRKVASK